MHTCTHAHMHTCTHAHMHTRTHRYRANYSMAQPLVWARGRGCSFATGECVDTAMGGGSTLEGFCASADETGCTPDHKAKGACNLVSYTSDLPEPYQWFPSDQTLGGGC